MGKNMKKGECPMALNFDLKSKIEETVKKLQNDPALLAKFQKDPVKTVEGLIGVDLPDGQLQPLVTGIKAKLTAGDLGDKLGGLKNLF